MLVDIIFGSIFLLVGEESKFRLELNKGRVNLNRLRNFFF